MRSPPLTQRRNDFIILWTSLTILGMALPAAIIVAHAFITLRGFLPPTTVAVSVLLGPTAMGTSAGFFQTMVGRRLSLPTVPWVIASAIGWLVAPIALVLIPTLISPAAAQYAVYYPAIVPAAIAIPQCIALRGFGRQVLWLIPASTLGLLVGGLILSSLVATVPSSNGPGEGILQGISIFVMAPLSLGLPSGFFTALAIWNALGTARPASAA
jgi:hypothetical protein